MDMFFGEKLADLRELNGMSRKNLADLLSVSEQAVWQYEKKDVIPKIELLNQIRSLFNVESKYFFETDELRRSVDESQVAYRPKDRDSRKKTRLELRFLDFHNYYLDAFEQTLKLPQATISDLQKRVQKYIQKNPEMSRGQLIETIAKGSRRILKVTNNRDLMYLLERSGIYIVEKDLGATIDAYSASTSDRTFIVLGSLKKSAVRRNFDLAHELGHILLHNDIDMAILDKSEVDKLENEANTFAGAFLLPQEEFTQDFQQLARKSNPDFYIDLKQKYAVSIAAMEFRAYHLGLMSYQEHRYFWGKLSKLGYKSLEPLDDKLAPLKPGKIRALVKLVLDHHLINAKAFFEQQHILPNFLVKLFSLDDHFFDQYLEKSPKYFNEDSIISMLDDYRQNHIS